MKNYFEVKVKYRKTGEDGKEKKVSEAYLFDAVNWTDAEARTFKAMEENVRGDFKIDSIKTSKIIELFAFEDGELWFKVSVAMMTLSEGAKKEKKIKENFLVMADNVQEALNRLNSSLDYLLVPYVVTSISASNIVDVFPYQESKEEAKK